MEHVENFLQNFCNCGQQYESDPHSPSDHQSVVDVFTVLSQVGRVYYSNNGCWY